MDESDKMRGEGRDVATLIKMLIQLAAVLFLLVTPVIHAQTVYMAGDSTMAKNGGGSGSDG
jgi:hypothetical protein